MRHQVRDDLQAILLRHPEIEQENVGSKLMLELAGFLSVSSFSYNLDVLL
jgi:hypothetical protein